MTRDLRLWFDPTRIFIANAWRPVTGGGPFRSATPPPGSRSRRSAAQHLAISTRRLTRQSGIHPISNNGM